jgi:hypothetical protein
MPSSTAAFVAETASSMRCFFSLSSTSVAAPTLMTATPAGELRQALLELLPVVVGVGLVDLVADLVDPALDLLVRAAAFDHRGLVLRHDDLARRTQEVQRGVLELEPDLLADDLGHR